MDQEATLQDTVILKRHAALFDDMGTAMGLDLQKQAIGGELPIEEISEAVLRCTKCAHPGKCARLLAITEQHATTPPDYCRNRDLLGYLQEQIS